MPVTTPPLIPEAFAQGGDRAVIPDTTVAVGRASYSAGFPPITMQPKIAGGVPPDGRDVNGILYALSAHALFLQGGQVFKYDSGVSTAIGGYGIGALVESTDGLTLWLNLVDSNTTDPDASGAGWVPVSSYGYSFINGLIGGTRTLTRVEARNDTIVLSGTLVANQNIVVPADLRAWRIVNLTTGAFTTTVLVSGGVGVQVPQGGYPASVGVYGNGTDIYLQVPPVALPIAVTPDANTLAKRDNVGDLFTRYFNGSAAAEAFTVANVMATNGSDGYLRKVTFANFLLQALSNAALTGIPTAPSAPAGTDSTQIATTHFALEAGVGSQAQAWVDVTASRAAGVTYTNSTAHPIMLVVSQSTNGGTFNITINGITFPSMGAGPNSVRATTSLIVPVGNTYSVSGFSTWLELR